MAALKALIVEDVPGDAYLIKKILEGFEYECELAHSYNIATVLINNFEFDLMILDINLPGKSGIDLIKTMEISPKRRPNKIIVNSGMSLREDSRRKLEGKVDFFLTKNVGMKSLTDLLATELSNQ